MSRSFNNNLTVMKSQMFKEGGSNFGMTNNNSKISSGIRGNESQMSNTSISP